MTDLTGKRHGLWLLIRARKGQESKRQPYSWAFRKYSTYARRQIVEKAAIRYLRRRGGKITGDDWHAVIGTICARSGLTEKQIKARSIHIYGRSVLRIRQRPGSGEPKITWPFPDVLEARKETLLKARAVRIRKTCEWCGNFDQHAPRPTGVSSRSLLLSAGGRHPLERRLNLCVACWNKGRAISERVRGIRQTSTEINRAMRLITQQAKEQSHGAQHQ